MITNMKELEGRKVTGLLVNDDQSTLVVETDQGDVIFDAYDDCCSETWFADITGVSALLGGTVLEAEDVELPEVVDGRTRQEYDQFYGVKLRTDKGYADIVYRNSSNGYYGGNLVVGKDRPENLTPITDDWRA